MTDSNPETFIQATTTWDMDQLCIDLAEIKGSKELTAIEKLHLRGLLCGNSPAVIAAKLCKNSQGVEVNLCRTIYPYVKELTRYPEDSIGRWSWRDVAERLEAAGYQKTKLENDAITSWPQIDWGNAPDTTNITFCGRIDELTTLKKWIVDDNCRLISLMGMGGIGKTALAVQLVEKIYQEFDYVVWRSMAQQPGHENPLVQIFPGEEAQDTFKWLDYLSAHRCLIVLDSFETILNDHPVGSYRKGFEIYSELLQRIGKERHQSCLLIISREQPQELRLSDDDGPIRTFQLGELLEAAQILLEKKLLDAGENWRTLVEIYGGNPLALQIISALIQDSFGGSVIKFLGQNTTILDPDLRDVLTQQFDRLSAPEKEVLLKLATAPQPPSFSQLLSLISLISSDAELRSVLRSLKRRSLIEQQFNQGDIGLTLPQVVMKFARRLLS
jgi:hypothetical protein